MKVGLIGKECWEVVGESGRERESEGEVEIDNEGETVETVEEGEPNRRSLLRLPTGITGCARVKAGDRIGS